MMFRVDFRVCYAVAMVPVAASSVQVYQIFFACFMVRKANLKSSNTPFLNKLHAAWFEASFMLVAQTVCEELYTTV